MTDSDRVQRIKDQLHDAVPFIEFSEEFGWQVYPEENPSNGVLEAGHGVTMKPVFEHLIGTKQNHPQLKSPAPVVTIAGSPYLERSHMVSIDENVARFIADAPGNIRFLVEKAERLQKIIHDQDIRLTRVRVALDGAGIPEHVHDTEPPEGWSNPLEASLHAGGRMLSFEERIVWLARERDTALL